jgi:hypothetical protein
VFGLACLHRYDGAAAVMHAVALPVRPFCARHSRSFGKFDQAEKDLQITRMQKNMIHRDLVPLADTVMRDADRDICPIVDTTAISDFVPRVIDCQSGFRQNANGVRATVRGFRLMYIQSRRRDT